MLDIWSQPTKIYLRTWPMLRYETTTRAIFRWNNGERSHERRVVIARRHADIPLNHMQYQIWDELRTEVALGERAGTAVWTGLAQWEDDEWCQDHAFFFVMSDRTIQQVISVHFDRWIISGVCQERSEKEYVDYTFNSRKMLDYHK
jgi:hypothetical protein